jgi:hypothetical protein
LKWWGSCGKQRQGDITCVLGALRRCQLSPDSSLFFFTSIRLELSL